MVSLDKYAIIIGKGDLVGKIIDSAKALNLDFVIAGIKGYSPRNIVNSHEHFWFYIGEVQKLIDNLKEKSCNKVILVGSIARPSILSLRADSLGISIIKKYMSHIGGDNNLLSVVIKILEDNGLEVVSPQSIDNSIFARGGILTKTQPSKDNMIDVVAGFKISKSLGVFDIGQSILFQQGQVLAVEAAEGTEKMIARSKSFIKKVGSGAILIKTRKENQDTRVDMPTIGDKTILQVKKVGIKGIVIEADNTIILNQEKTIYLADKYKIFICAVE